MLSTEAQELVRRSEEVYRRRYQSNLELTHPGFFVAIEPESEQYFLGNTLSSAAQASREAYPNRRYYVLRVGHEATVEIGGSR